MSCRRAFDIDLSAFVADASGPEWADFRAHYSGCADCAAEVRVWTELHETLRAGAVVPSPHPAEALLVEYAERPNTLPANDRQSIQHHIAGCRLCTDELTTLRRFDFATLATPAGAPARPVARRRISGLSRGIGRIGRVLVHPAFAYAVVLLLLVPVLVRERGVMRRAPTRDAVPAEGAPASVPKSAAPVDLPAQRAEKRRDEAVAKSQPDRAAAKPPAAAHNELRDAEGTGALSSEPGEGDTMARPAPPPRARERLAAAPAGPASAPRASEDLLTSGTHDLSLSLQPGTQAEIRGRDIGRALRLRVPLPAGTRQRRVQFRIIGPDAGRELREQVDAGVTSQLDVTVPAEWLVPGTYSVELVPAASDAAIAKTDQSRRTSPDSGALTEPEFASRFTLTIR